MYTIKQAAARTGVPIALLRAWERRYHVVEPARTASGYRLYDETALDRIRAMRRLVEAGWAPSVAAAAIVSGEAPSDAASDDTGTGSSDVAGVAPMSDRPPLVDAFLEAAAALDGAALEVTLDAMLASGTFETVVDDLLLPALRAVGDGWSTGAVSVAAEHAASHAVLRRLSAAFQAAGRAAPPRGAILVGLPPGARHELAALAFAVAARRAGLPILYLGPDLPVADWVTTAHASHPRAVVVASPTRADAAGAADVGRALLAADPDLIVAFGGGAADRALDAMPSTRRVLVLPHGMRAAVDALTAALAASALEISGSA